MADAIRSPSGGQVLVWPRMQQLLQSLLTHTRVACRAGRKVSKTYGAAILALWWAVTKPGGRVILTGPTYRTVQTELWRDIRELIRSTTLQLPECSVSVEHGIRWPDGREIRGFTADKPEAASGTSGENQLYIVDEASGMPGGILDTLLGNLAGGGSLLMLSNPTQPGGFFHEVFSQPSKHSRWSQIHISALESPNVLAGRVVVPGLATAEWVEEMRAKWGEQSDLYRVHVLGEFPGQGDDAVIGLSLILEAVEAGRSAQPNGQLQIGVDPARYGDDETAIVARRGSVALGVEAFRGLDTVQIAERVVALVERHRVDMHERPVVAVDVTGGLGAGPADILRRDRSLVVVEVNSSESADNPEDFGNTRTQLWYAVREWLEGGGAIPDDPDLQQDLASARYGIDARGRRVVEPKDRTKARLGRSPDRADALALSIIQRCPDPKVARAATARAASSSIWAGMGRGFG